MADAQPGFLQWLKDLGTKVENAIGAGAAGPVPMALTPTGREHLKHETTNTAIGQGAAGPVPMALTSTGRENLKHGALDAIRSGAAGAIPVALVTGGQDVSHPTSQTTPQGPKAAQGVTPPL